MRHSPRSIHRTLVVAALAALTGCPSVKTGGGLPLAPNQEPGVVTLEAGLAHRTLRALAPGETVARLRVSTLPLGRAARSPVNLALVVDTSGSMEGAAIRDARAASVALLDALSDGDRLAVVTFDSDARVLVPSTPLDARGRAAVRARIGTMTARGTTDLAGGLQAGIAEVSRNFTANGVNRIVLMSDGVPNEAAPILPLADAAGQRGISITSLGLGIDYDETMMGAIAVRSGGRFHFIKESQAVAEVFRDEVLRLHQVVGRNLILTVRPGPGVIIKGVVGQPPVAPSGATTIALGDLCEGETRDVIVRLAAPARREGAAIEMLDGILAFDDAVNGSGRAERKVFLAAHATTSQAELDGGRDLDILRAAARATTAAHLVDAIALARAGRPVEAGLILDDTERDARAEALTLDDAELSAQVKSIAPLREALPVFAAEQARFATLAAEVPTSDAPRPTTAKRAVALYPPEAPSVLRAIHDAAIEQLQGRRRRW